MEHSKDNREQARVDDLRASVLQVMGSLESFLKFEGPDPAARRSRWRPLLDERLPEQGHGAQSVLDALSEIVIPNGLRTGAPGFSGWVTTMPTVVPAVAGFAASLAAAQRWYSTPGNFLELLALRWLAELLELGPETGGTFTSGGAVANLVCLAAARQHTAERIGVDLTRDGAHVLPSPCVYVASTVHDVSIRALTLLGLGTRSVRSIPLDERRLPVVSELARMVEADVAAGRTPVAVIGTAGDVRTGAIDPLEAMADVAHAHGIWFHVDGAYGGFGLLDPRVRALYGELTKIDSMAVDPHKWLAVPLGCGAALVRDPDLLQRALAIGRPDFHKFDPRTAADPGSPFDEFGEGSPYSSIDFSARSRGLTVWAALKEIGKHGMQARVARHLDCARRVAERVKQHSDLELLAPPVLSICCFRYRPPGVHDEAALNQLNENVLRGIRARGRSVPSSTVVGESFAIRPCFVGPNTDVSDADALVDDVLAVGAELSRNLSRR